MKLIRVLVAALLVMSVTKVSSGENVFIWCTNKSSAKRVASAYQHASFKSDRLSLDHIHGALGNKACGLTSDVAMAKFNGNQLAPPVDVAQTKDGQNLPLFGGVGGRVLIPVNF